MGGASHIIENRCANSSPDGFDRAAALGFARVRHILLEGDDQIFGVHDDSTPWYLRMLYHGAITYMLMLV